MRDPMLQLVRRALRGADLDPADLVTVAERAERRERLDGQRAA